jgi:hypothetical protein
MSILESHYNYTSAISRINEVHPYYFRDLPMNFIYDHLGDFRIVKMANGSDMDWYLLHKRKNIVSRFFGLFTKEFIQWYVVCGCDVGAYGYYNYQTKTSANPQYHLMYTIPDFLRSYLGNTQYFSGVRDGYPRGSISKELDIRETLTNLKVSKEENLMHSITECSIVKDYELERAIK